MSEQSPDDQALKVKSAAGITTGNFQLRVPKVVEALQEEIRRHPSLLLDLKAANARGEIKTFEDALAFVAAFVDVTLHGVYGAGEIQDIVEKLLNRLIAKRPIQL